MVFPVSHYQRAMTWKIAINIYKKHPTAAAAAEIYHLQLPMIVFELF